MKMTSRNEKLCLALGMSVLLSAVFSDSAFAANKFLLQGIQNYQDGDFAAAAGNLGAAMPTDFNNPTLHYYMGNCCVHLKQMESAVREFRIAYALDPVGQVGKFAKQALDYLDVDAQGQGMTKRAAPSVVPRMDPAMERALATLDKQGSNGYPASRSQQPQSLSNLPWWMQQQKKSNEVPPELSRYLDSLRKQYETNTPGGIKSAQPTEMQRSADNLKTLLKENNADGRHHLSPVGTNLYTRNYAQGNKQPAADKSKGSAPATQIPSTQVVPPSQVSPTKTPTSPPQSAPSVPGAVPGKDGTLFEWK